MIGGYLSEFGMLRAANIFEIGDLLKRWRPYEEYSKLLSKRRITIC